MAELMFDVGSPFMLEHTHKGAIIFTGRVGLSVCDGRLPIFSLI